ncbi:MAG: DUF550 domain-containing protein [Gammaproteobacteria bacterium]|nr:DUF550 domain-containing protein [Gammaproteobacteria bacterium]
MTKNTTASYDLVAHLHRQRAFSERTFGPGSRADGVLDHIAKELREIAAHPADLEEWIDVVLLALDGAWRAGYTPEAIASALATQASLACMRSGGGIRWCSRRSMRTTFNARGGVFRVGLGRNFPRRSL